MPRKVDVKQSNFESSVQHVVLGDRVTNFPEGFCSYEDIPILPYGSLAKLVIAHYHSKYHKEVDTICGSCEEECLGGEGQKNSLKH